MHDSRRVRSLDDGRRLTSGEGPSASNVRVAMVDSGAFTPPYDIALAESLRALGVDVELIAPKELLLWSEETEPAKTVRRRGWLRRKAEVTKKLLSHGLRMTRLAYLSLIRRIDVVHFQWLPLPAFDYLFLRIVRSRVPVLFTMHNTSLFHGTTSRVRGMGFNACLRQFDRVIVHSRYSRERAIVVLAIAPTRIELIPHGAFSHYASLSSQPVRDPAGLVDFLFVGSIKPYKGLSDLIEALGLLNEAGHTGKWRLTVAGEPGMAMDEVLQRVTVLGIEAQVHWVLRRLTERELAEHLHLCDVVVLPYREIDQSGVLMAAVGVGKPVIATDVGAFSEIVQDGHNGLLVAPGQPDQLGAALARAVSDPAALACWGENMHALREGELGWQSVAAQTLSAYRHVL